MSSPGPVMSIGTRTTNAELMVDCRTLGYLSDTMLVADVTYGLGRFWSLWKPQPPRFYASDSDPARSPGAARDFRATGYESGMFDAVVLDAPYKLSGTNTGRGPAASNVDYGIDAYMSVDDRMALIYDGVIEGARILAPTGHLLVKCQDQVCGGKVHWQTIDIAIEATRSGLDLVDQLHVQSYRAQPPGRRQVHARRDYSTLLVFRRPK